MLQYDPIINNATISPRLCVRTRHYLALVTLVLAIANPLTFSQAPTSAPDDQLPRITPLRTAVVGDWATYDMLQGRQTVRVEHTTLLLADIEVQSFLDGMPVGLPAARSIKQDSDWAIDFAASDGAELKSAHDTIDVAGRRLNCRYTVATWKVGPTECERRVWMHPDIPVYGVARMELRHDGKVTARMNLSRFGHGPAATQTASQPASQPATDTTTRTDPK